MNKTDINYWLVKSEPFKYAWHQLEQDGFTIWDGVRNWQARNNLLAMQESDLVFFYHSNEGKNIVGLAQVSKKASHDPSSDMNSKWVAVEIVPLRALKNPVGLGQIKAHPELGQIALIKQSRLSVMPVSAQEFEIIMALSEVQF